jgi:hypothetical protein
MELHLQVYKSSCKQRYVMLSYVYSGATLPPPPRPPGAHLCASYNRLLHEDVYFRKVRLCIDCL